MAELAEGARLLSECGGKLPPRVRIPVSPPFYSGCQKNVPLFERFFATTAYTSLPYFGTYF